jgi:hypothetical protein
MRLLPLATAGSVLAGIAYFSSAPPAPGPPPPQVLTDTANPPLAKVPFVVVSKVRVIWEQHLKLSAATSRGDTQPAQIRIRLAAEDIREKLLADGIHEEAMIIEVVGAAALQAGLNGQQCAAVVAAFRGSGGQPRGGSGGFVGALRESLTDAAGLPPDARPKE